MRSVIIPHRVFDAAHIGSVVQTIPSSINDAGASREYGDSREGRSAVADADNVGKLNPIPTGFPETDVNVDIFTRVPGNPDGARWGFKDHSASTYKGKSPTNIPYDLKFLKYFSSAADAPHRPKLLPLASGDLLLVYVQQASNALCWAVYDASAATWSSVTTINSSSFYLTFTGIVNADVVQMSDTNELVMMVMFYASNNEVVLTRYTSALDTAAGISWVQSPVSYLPITPSPGTYRPTGMGIEVLNNGRIAMLSHLTGGSYTTYVTSVIRSYSDDRGISWSTWASATSNFGESTVAGPLSWMPGGVGITRARTGSLVAAVGVTTGAMGFGGPTVGPGIMLLVSDDGDTWTGMIRYSPLGNDLDKVGDQPLLPVGVTEAGIALGDDGLVRMIGCLHGYTSGSDVYFDDLCLYTFKKPDVTGSDVGPVAPTNGDTTSTDVIEAVYDSVNGIYTPTDEQITAHRFFVLRGQGSGQFKDVSPTPPSYIGFHTIDAVSYRGALWCAAVVERTSDDLYSLALFRLNAWTELNELPADAKVTTDYLRGGVYSNGWIAAYTPADDGLTVTGSGTESLDETTGGWKIVAAGGSQFYTTLNSANGSGTKPRFVRVNCIPIAASADAVGFKIASRSGSRRSNLTVYLTPTSIKVIDASGPTTLANVTGLSMGTYGVEIVVGYVDYTTLLGVMYRVLTADPEDAVFASTGASPLALGNTADADSNFLTIDFGHFSTIGGLQSCWRGILTNIGVASPDSTHYNLYLNSGVYAWDAIPPLFYEFTYDSVTYDDGLRHGTRAPKCNPKDQYLRKGLNVTWRGAAAAAEDNWNLKNSYARGLERVFAEPVLATWRSNDDDSVCNIVMDAGNDERWNPDSIALFGINAKKFYVQFDNASTFNSNAGNPSLSVLCDVSSGTPDVSREFFRRNANFSVEGTGSSTIRLTGDSAQPLSPHQFRSDDKVKWYLWSEQNARSYLIKGNDGYRIFLAESASGAASGAIMIYPDKIAFALSGTGIGAASAGYRYMRLRIPAQVMQGDLLPSGSFGGGYFQLGLMILGQRWDLSDPHPEWGWNREAIPPTDEVDLSNKSKWVRQLLDGQLEAWTMAFTGLLDRPIRTALTSAPGTRAGYMRIRDMMGACQNGEKIVALMPEYYSGMDTSVMRSFDVYPVRVLGPWKFHHQAYESCRTSGGSADIDGNNRPIGDLEAITFAEIF